jgi:hypothetical protein
MSHQFLQILRKKGTLLSNMYIILDDAFCLMTFFSVFCNGFAKSLSFLEWFDLQKISTIDQCHRERRLCPFHNMIYQQNRLSKKFPKSPLFESFLDRPVTSKPLRRSCLTTIEWNWHGQVGWNHSKPFCYILSWSQMYIQQSYDPEFQLQRWKTYNTTSSIVRF